MKLLGFCRLQVLLPLFLCCYFNTVGDTFWSSKTIIMKSTDFGGSNVAGGWESEATLKTSVLLPSAAHGDIHNSHIYALFKS